MVDVASLEPGPANRPQSADDALTLFGAVVQRNAYGTETRFDMPNDAAVRQRDLALQRVEGTADDQDRAVIDQALAAMIERGRAFSANDLRDLLPVVRKSLVGARFLAAAKRGEIIRVGYVPSSEPTDHCRPIALWRPR